MTEIPYPASAAPLPRFCQQCAARLIEQDRPDDSRSRLVCESCGFVHYLNPRVIINVLPERGGRVLLIRRGIEPSKGLWTFPGGFLELGETAEEGAAREANEEVGLDVKVGAVLGVYTGITAGHVSVVFRAASVRGRPSPGPEVLETAWFLPQKIPWDGLAFETTRQALRDWDQLQRHRGRRRTPAP